MINTNEPSFGQSIARRKDMKLIALALILIALGSTSHGSDHIDGPVTTKHRVADLSDFYAFPTPNKPGSLTLILNTYPVVPKKGHFTDKATYVFLVRKASVAGTKEAAKFNTSEEVVINCRFTTPYRHEDHKVECKSTNGLQAANKYESVAQVPGGDFKIYSGMRSDSFFFNAGFANAIVNKGVINPPKDDNTMSRINVLTIVLEIDLKKLYPDSSSSLFAVATAVVTRDNQTAPLRILDRIGRPEITNVSMATRAGDKELRDLYNAERPFSLSANAAAEYEARLVKNISYFDGLDKKSDLSASDTQTIAKVLTDDFLVVDSAKPCGGDSFLEIEKSLIQGKIHQTCGGRRPVSDIMDTLFTLYIGGFNGQRIRDGVDAPHKAISNDFPHLAKPDLDLISRGKAAIARKILGIKD